MNPSDHIMGMIRTEAIEQAHEAQEDRSRYRANFLWDIMEDDSVEEAGYEFANAATEEYRAVWWKILVERIEARAARGGR